MVEGESRGAATTTPGGGASVGSGLISTSEADSMVVEVRELSPISLAVIWSGQGGPAMVFVSLTNRRAVLPPSKDSSCGELDEFRGRVGAVRESVTGMGAIEGR